MKINTTLTNSKRYINIIIEQYYNIYTNTCVYIYIYTCVQKNIVQRYKRVAVPLQDYYTAVIYTGNHTYSPELVN